MARAADREPGWPKTAAMISVRRPPTRCQAASSTQPAAAEVLPVFSPTIWSEPSSRLRFRTGPATGTTAVRVATMPASAGWAITARPSRTWSAAVLTVDAASPDGSV